MSGKQSAKPRFGGVFFCLQKSALVIRHIHHFLQSVCNNVSEVCAAKHQSDFQRYSRLLSGFHSNA